MTEATTSLPCARLMSRLGAFTLLMLLSTAALAWDPVPASGNAPVGYAGGWYQDAGFAGGSEYYTTLGSTMAGSGVTQAVWYSGSNTPLRVSGVASASYAAAVNNNDYVYATFSAKANWAPNGYRVRGYRYKPNDFSDSQQNFDSSVRVAIYDGNTKVADIGTAQATVGASQYITVAGTSPALQAGRDYQIRFYVYSASCGGGCTVELDNMELLLEARQLVKVNKTWVNPTAGNIATITPVGTTPTTAFVSTAGAADSTDTSPDYDVNTASSFNLSETVTGGTYRQVLACSVLRTTGTTATTLSTTTAAITTPYTVLTGDRGITCTFTNSRAALTVVKNVVNDNGGAATVSAFNVATNMGALTFGAGSTVGSTTTYTANPLYSATGGTFTLTESDVANYTEGTWSCTGTGVTMGGTAFNAGSVTLTNIAKATCTITNDDSNAADLAILKAVSPTTPVSPGNTLQYTLTVTNNGPATAIGASVKDTPGPGLNCPATGAVSCSGSGCPATAQTVGTLTGASGITLGTLSAGQSAVLTFSCTAQ